jgi:hypothetical protein
VLETVPATQGDTVEFNSAEFIETLETPTKAISRELVPDSSGEFDPYKTVMARPEGSGVVGKRDTQDLAPENAPPRAAAPTSASLPPLPASTEDSGSWEESSTLPSMPSGQLPPADESGSFRGDETIASYQPMPPPKFTPPASAQPSQPPPATRPAKKSRLPLVLGILAVLLVLGIGAVGAAYLLILRPMLQTKSTQDEPRNTNQQESTPTPVVENTNPTKPEPPPYSPPAGAIRFVNSRQNLAGKLADHYVDFSFYYPREWQKDPTAGVSGATNFAKVERRIPPDFTQENFAVGLYSSAGSAEADRTVFHSLAENLSKQFQKNFPEYRKVSEGPTTAGVYDGYEFRFEGMSRNTDKGDIKLWGRVIFVPPVDGSKDGVTLLMLATSLAPELSSVKDVGEKGQLPMVLESFRFGKK